MKTQLPLLLIFLIVFSCKQKTGETSQLTFEQQIDDYFQKFPYQETYNYFIKYSGGGDAKQLNKIFVGSKPVLEKAGNDVVVRMNNDTTLVGSYILMKGM